MQRTTAGAELDAGELGRCGIGQRRNHVGRKAVNELAHVAWNRGRPDEALRLAEEANALALESPSPWNLRGQIAASSLDSEATKRRTEAEREVNRFCSDQNGLTALQARLGEYLQIWAIGCPQRPIDESGNRSPPGDLTRG